MENSEVIIDDFAGPIDVPTETKKNLEVLDKVSSDEMTEEKFNAKMEAQRVKIEGEMEAWFNSQPRKVKRKIVPDAKFGNRLLAKLRESRISK